MPRLGYSKSRNGCLRCKKRRVKCDETVPCAACIRHGARCSLLDAPPKTIRAESSRGQQIPLVLAKVSEGTKTVRRLAPIPGLPTVVPAPPPPVSVSDLVTNPAVGPAGATLYPPADAVSAMSSSPDTFQYFSEFGVRTAGGGGTCSGDCAGANNAARSPSWIDDLELMHHYTAVTAGTVQRSPIWKVEAPLLAMRDGNSFLMHQILAFAAYHKAYLSRESDRHEEYFLRASQHQTEAVQGIRAALSQEKLERGAHTVSALFLSGSILSLSAFATCSPYKAQQIDKAAKRKMQREGCDPNPAAATAAPDPAMDTDDDDGGPAPTIEHLIQIFMLIRGMITVLQANEQEIKEGPLRAMFDLGEQGTLSGSLSALMERLSHLQIRDRGATAITREGSANDTDRSTVAGHEGDLAAALETTVTESAASPQSSTGLPATVVEALCQVQVDNLLECLEDGVANSPVSEVRALVRWPMHLTEEFISLLRARHPAALVVLAHYCVLLYCAADNWYTSSWGEVVAREIAVVLSADPRWEEDIRWPMALVGAAVPAQDSSLPKTDPGAWATPEKE